jgi:hypothetical protein
MKLSNVVQGKTTKLAVAVKKDRFKTVSQLFQPTIISFEYHNICKGEINEKLENNNIR